MIFKIQYERAGSHIHMGLFAARQANMAFAKMGDLCCRVEELEDFRLACSGIAFSEKAAVPPPSPEGAPRA